MIGTDDSSLFNLQSDSGAPLQQATHSALTPHAAHMSLGASQLLPDSKQPWPHACSTGKIPMEGFCN